MAGVAAAILMIVVVPLLSGFATDWLWFREIQFESVFLRSLLWRVSLFLVGTLLGLIVVAGSIRLAQRGSGVTLPVFMQSASGARVDVSRFVPRLLLIGSVVVALITGVSASALWMTFLKGLHGQPVGLADPLFGRDIGFYLFTLPALSALLNTLVTLIVIAIVAVGVLHVLSGALVLPSLRAFFTVPGARGGATGRASATPGATTQLGVLIALFFILIAIRLWFVGTADLLYSTTGPLVGASYTDVNVRLPGIRLSAGVALIAAVMALVGVQRRKLPWFAFLGTAAFVLVSILGRALIPAAVQSFVVSPNELAREKPYLERHIAATRTAWRLDSVQTRDLGGEAQLGPSDIRANASTIENVRLWERDLLKQTFGQLQEIRTYYDFASVNDDRYMIDGKYRQVHLSARELNPASLPTRNFINERLTFTHGMGITMAPVNQVTTEGLPVLFIKDVPPVSTVSLKITRPQIYFGELTTSYVFVGTGQQEFDYPAGDKNVYANYTGKGGVPIGSFLRRALFAWEFGSADIMFSSYIASSARILYRRNVLQRARLALPFLSFDSEPYVVLTDAGELKWVLDAYTSSDAYPYAQPLADGTNYMRNSVKVVIDAYDGTVDAYLAEPKDPVALTYAAIFGPIFKPMAAMPADIRRHVRYPGDLFRAQSNLHATYHMVQADAFYHREDTWQSPAVSDKDRTLNPFMRHIILRLPGEKEPEFIYMTPFTPRGKDNLAAWMVARMDGDNYGKLVVYRFPKQRLVYGPRQIANRINQDTDISRQITLWDQKGSEVIRGELLVIPINESLIYVQPVYLRAEGGKIPELKRVVVAHENRVAMAETLEEGLALLFGGAAGARAPVSGADSTGANPGSVAATRNALSGTAATLATQASAHYDRAIAAQRAGDWATYGREIEQLGAILRQLRASR